VTEPTHFSARPVRHWVFDGAAEPLGPDLLPPADWPGWVRYDNAVEARKRTTRDLDALAPPVRAAFRRLRAVGAVAAWCDRLGYAVCDDPSLHGGGLHVTAGGGSLGTHLDYSRHPVLRHWRRALNVIAFLHPEWRPEWGGQLRLTDPDGRPVAEIDPLPGRVVAFEVGDLSYHGVAPTAADAPDRVSAAVYFLTPATAADTRTRALFLPPR
jgi:hypothetical protein